MGSRKAGLMPLLLRSHDGKDSYLIRFPSGSASVFEFSNRGAQVGKKYPRLLIGQKIFLKKIYGAQDLTVRELYAPT